MVGAPVSTVAAAALADASSSFVALTVVIFLLNKN